MKHHPALTISLIVLGLLGSSFTAHEIQGFTKEFSLYQPSATDLHQATRRLSIPNILETAITIEKLGDENLAAIIEISGPCEGITRQREALYLGGPTSEITHNSSLTSCEKKNH